jgi:hypothetical protein
MRRREHASLARRRRARARAGRVAVVVLAVLLGAAPGALAQRRKRQRPPARKEAPAAPAPTAANEVAVQVVEVAGGRAYLTPGAGAGIRAGQTVRIGAQRLRIAAVTESYTVVELGKRGLREGMRGVAVKEEIEARGESERRAPVPLESFRGAWQAPRLPATAQNPAHVPLMGVAGGTGRYRVVLIGAAASVLPLEGERGSVNRVSLGAALHAEPWQGLPLGVDADLSVSRWLGAGIDDNLGLGAGSRPTLRVRELRLRYGEEYAPLAGIGRLRAATATVGVLDGVRVRTPRFSGFSLAAFGGYVPDATTAEPATDNARFGVELGYSDPDSAWRPWIEVVAHGSRFAGALDERRLSSHASVHHQILSLSSYAELSMFERDNPWGADRVELTAAGIDASVHLDDIRVSARIDKRQPERSRWLASLLPQSWLCTAAPQPDPDAVEPCAGARDARYLATLDAGYHGRRLSLTAGASTVGTTTESDTATPIAGPIEEVAAFADLRVVGILGESRLHLGALAARSALLSTLAVRAGVGAPIGDALDLELSYRPAALLYNADIATIFEHRVGLDLVYTPHPTLDLAATAEGVLGDDVTALGLFATAVWRPRI